MKLSELASLLCADVNELANFSGEEPSKALTDAEAQDISTAWVAETERLAQEAPVQVEYSAEGGETIHEEKHRNGWAVSERTGYDYI